MSVFILVILQVEKQLKFEFEFFFITNQKIAFVNKVRVRKGDLQNLLGFYRFEP